MAKDLEELLKLFYETQPKALMSPLSPAAPGMAPNQPMTPMQQEDVAMNITMDTMPELKKVRGTPGNLGESDPATQKSDAPMTDMGSVAPIDYKKEQEAEVEQRPDIMFGKNDVSTLEALKAAQRARNFNQFGADMARAGAMISSAISGIENKGLKEIADVTEKRAKQPIEDFSQQIEILKKDPNSAISQGYKELLEKQLGMKFGGDVSAADIEPFLTASMKKQLGLTDYQKRMLDIYEKRLENEGKRIGQGETREERLAKTQEWKEKEKNELSDKQTDAIADIDITISSINDLKELKPAFDTGPIQSRLASFKQAIGTDEPKRTAFKARVGRTLANYVRSMSGLAVTDAERQFLQTLIPNDADQDETFLEKIKDFKKELESIRNIKLDSFTKQGKNTQSFRKSSSKPIKRKTRDGRIALFDSITQEFIGYEDE